MTEFRKQNRSNHLLASGPCLANQKSNLNSPQASDYRSTITPENPRFKTDQNHGKLAKIEIQFH